MFNLKVTGLLLLSLLCGCKKEKQQEEAFAGLELPSEPLPRYEPSYKEVPREEKGIGGGEEDEVKEAIAGFAKESMQEEDEWKNQAALILIGTHAIATAHLRGGQNEYVTTNLASGIRIGTGALPAARAPSMELSWKAGEARFTACIPASKVCYRFDDSIRAPFVEFELASPDIAYDPAIDISDTQSLADKYVQRINISCSQKFYEEAILQ